MPDFAIWPQCNIGCVFCSNPVEGYRETTDQYNYEALEKKLRDYKRGLKTFVKFDEVRDYFNLTGGEPTAHPEFTRVLAMMRREFPQTMIRLLSNGRMFSYDDFARRTLGIAGAPFEAAIPLFGYDAATHEATSRTPKSFDQTTAGLRNILRFREDGQRVEVRVIVTKIQLRSLEGLVEYLLREFPEIDRIAFLFVEIEGFAERHKNVLVTPMSEAAAQLDALYPRLKRFKEFRLLHFPLCTVPERLWPHVWNTLAGFKTTYLDVCRTQCLYRDKCVGVHRSYVRTQGASDIRPFTQARNVAWTADPYHPVSSVGGN